jgi:hypothetical protein
MMTGKPEHDLSKIPKWARQEIERLRADNEAMAARLAAGPGDSDVFADPYSDVKRPLGRGTMIEFGDKDSEHGAWDVSLQDGELHVTLHSLRAAGTAAVIPWSSTSVRVRSVRL